VLESNIVLLAKVLELLQLARWQVFESPPNRCAGWKAVHDALVRRTVAEMDDHRRGHGLVTRFIGVRAVSSLPALTLPRPPTRSW
jgi:hypothetical protein